MVDYMFCDDENFRFDPDYQVYTHIYSLLIL